MLLTLSTLFAVPIIKAEKADAQAVKTVYFTFDDGPSAVTEEILDILKRENIKATFFVIGPSGAQTDERLLRIVSEGHSIGLHSMCHDYDRIYSSKEAFFSDLDEEASWIYSVTGTSPKIFRFPGGSQNSHSETWLKRELFAEAENRGLTWYDWNCDSRDSLGDVLSPKAIAENILSSEAVGSDTVIVLMHDSSMQKTAPVALEILIETFREMGYVFEKLE